MRIAVTGAHGTGKSTLIEDFLAARPGYGHAEEPYWQMAARGRAFSYAPDLDEMVDQLDESVATILDAAGSDDMIFDRCPIDFMAYAEVLAERRGEDWTPSGRQLDGIEAALATLDLLAFLPIGEPDEIPGPIERPNLRRAVDRRLGRMVRDDALGLLAEGPLAIEICGPPAARLAQLLAATASGRAPGA